MLEKQQYIVLTTLALAISTLFLPLFETHFLERNYTKVIYGYEFMFIYPVIAIHCSMAYYIPFENRTKAWILWSTTLAFFLLFILVIAFAFSFGGGSAQTKEHLAIGSWVLLVDTIFLFGYGLYCILKAKSGQK